MLRQDVDDLVHYAIPLNHACKFFDKGSLSGHMDRIPVSFMKNENTKIINDLMWLFMHSSRVRRRENTLNDIQEYDYYNQVHDLFTVCDNYIQPLPLSYLQKLYVSYGYSPKSDKHAFYQIGTIEKRQIINRLKQLRRKRYG
jgi:hypothetical protein